MEFKLLDRKPSEAFWPTAAVSYSVAKRLVSLVPLPVALRFLDVNKVPSASSILVCGMKIEG